MKATHEDKLQEALWFMQLADIPMLDGRTARQARIDAMRAEYGLPPVAWRPDSYARRTSRLAPSQCGQVRT